MAVRKIKKNHRNVTGIAAHRKSIGAAEFESTLERDLLLLLEFSPDIKNFEVQPVRIDWEDDEGKARSYTPDVLIVYGRDHPGERTPLLCEVKYRSDLRENWFSLKPKFKAAVHFAAERGWRFKIMTEKEIRTPYLENLRFLCPHVRQGPESPEKMEMIDQALIRLGTTTPDALTRSVCTDEWNRAALLPTLWYLIGTFQIGIDLQQPLTMTSPIWNLS